MPHLTPPGSARVRRRWLLLTLPLMLAVALLGTMLWLLTPVTVDSAAAPPAVPKFDQPAQQTHSDAWRIRYTSPDTRNTRGAAWGDVDGDGDLDLAVGNGLPPQWLSWLSVDSYDQTNQLYVNEGGGQFTIQPLGEDSFDTRDMAWGDWDGDGDLDLAIANGGEWGGGQVNQVYENVNGRLTYNPNAGVGWASPDESLSSSVAWGDWDGDGDLDLAIGNEGVTECYATLEVDGYDLCYANPYGHKNQVYENISGTLQLDPTAGLGWESAAALRTHDLQWGDWDGDGDLDLAIANYEGEDQVYENISGTLQLDPANGLGWQAPTPDRTQSIAWGDWDSDGDLDLAAGGGSMGNEPGAFIKVYENISDTLQLDPDSGFGWQWVNNLSRAKPVSLAWGDSNGDGDLDLFLGNNAGGGWGYRNRILENVNGELLRDRAAGHGWQSPLRADLNSETTYAIAVGDADGDGDLDLAVANGGIENGGQANVIFENRAPVVAINPQVWESPDARRSTNVAWGDWDGDGDLDLAVGNYGQPNQLYENDNGVLGFDPANGLGWESPSNDTQFTTSVAWGDWDGDDDLDLAIGNYEQPNQVFENISGTLVLDPENGLGWREPIISSKRTLGVAWGDLDRDGDLDLAVANEDDVAQVYANVNGGLALDSQNGLGWVSAEPLTARDLAWGDWDDDGDLDLALGARVYENIGGTLALNERRGLGWSGPLDARSVSWGDMNGDGRIDLAVGTWYKNRVYENMGGFLAFGGDYGWESSEIMRTHDLAWGDVDGDGDLDLAVANAANWGFEPNQVYENIDGSLFETAAYETDDTRTTLGYQQKSHGVAWGDVDGDGDLDLAFANYCTENECDTRDRVNQVYFNTLQGLQTGGTTVSGTGPAASVQDPDPTSAAYFYASPQIISSSIISVPFRLQHPDEVPIGRVEMFYSRFGGGENWQPAAPTAGTPTTNLATSRDGRDHLFGWDTFASDFFGRSDNVQLRLKVYMQPPSGEVAPEGTYRYLNAVSGSYERPFITATSPPFRVQSTQIKVVDENGDPVEGAIVYRLPAGRDTGATLMPSPQNPLATDADGLLPGGGELVSGDRLVALRPITVTEQISFTDRARLFHTSASPVESGLAMRTFREPGIIELTVSEDNPLLLFDLLVSLEWDASEDEEFMLELRRAFQRASELLFDVTNGQAALGNLHVFHGRQGPDQAGWNLADIQVLANNSVRPSAAYGGVVTVPLSETVRTATGEKVVADAYLPQGKIRMGPAWDPFGENTADLSEDWWRALAHELAHYLLFLPDNYLGFKGSDDQALGRINCPGSFMTSTYDPSYSEFLTLDEWEERCQSSLAARTTGRTDWETVLNFYPMLNEPDETLEGPHLLPLDLMVMTQYAPQDTRTTLPTRNFDVRNSADDRWRLPNGQAFLIQSQGTSDPSDDVLIALGSPTGGGDRLKVRGAFPGDRLCLIDNGLDQTYAGCVDSLDASKVKIQVGTPASGVPAWRPTVSVQPLSQTALQIEVEQSLAEGEQLQVQVFPAHYYSVPCFSGLAPTTVLQADGSSHSGTVELRLPAWDVWVHVQVLDDETRQAVSQFLVPLPEHGTQLPLVAGGGEGEREEDGDGATAVAPLPQDSDPACSPGNAFIFGLASLPVGGPNATGLGGPNATGLGGPNATGLGGPNATGLGGPNATGLGGPNATGLGGATARTFSAPALSADAQVVVYSVEGFFEPNGVNSLQVLPAAPKIEAQPWLHPVGQPYQVKLNEREAPRVIAYNYLQRDVPEGYEHTLNIYFLPDGGDRWEKLPTQRFVENLVVADLQADDGTYAVMATIDMPQLQAGWNLVAYTVPVSRTLEAALASAADVTAAVYAVEFDPQTGVVEPPPPVSDAALADPGANRETDIECGCMEFGVLYWIYVTDPPVPTLQYATPIRLPEGILR